MIFSAIEEKLFGFVNKLRLIQNEDFFLNPIFTPEGILKHYPKILIMCGDSDPVLDSNSKFALKLKMNQVSVLMKSYKYMQHGFFCFSEYGFEEVAKCLDDIVNFLL